MREKRGRESHRERAESREPRAEDRQAAEAGAWAGERRSGQERGERGEGQSATKRQRRAKRNFLSVLIHSFFCCGFAWFPFLYLCVLFSF